MRVTESLLAATLLGRSRSALERIALFQAQISSGRRILKPSDDPGLFAKSLDLRSTLREIHAFRDNASSAVAFMSTTESSLAEISDTLSRAKELVVGAINDTNDESSAAAIATELRSMIESVLLVANRRIGGRSLFAGLATRSDAYESVKGAVLYRGDHGDLLDELGPGLRVAYNLPGPAALETVPARLEGSADLDPAVSAITRLEDLRGGAGAVAGRIRITDSGGASADVDLMDASNLGQVVDGINAAGLAVTASLTADGKGIELVDGAGGTGPLVVEDLDEGTLAHSLGVAGTSESGILGGADLDPVVTENTPVALLFRGAGLGAGTWRIRNDGPGQVREAVVDPSGANTVGDLLDAIEEASTADGERLGLVARIEGASLVIESSILHTRLSVTDTAGPSAATLGISGVSEPSDVFALLEAAAAAVETRDTETMERSLRELTEAIERTAGIRGSYGARSRQVLHLAENLEDQKVDMTIRLSDVEDADLAEAAIELTKAETIYSASLAAGSRLFEVSLFSYLR